MLELRQEAQVVSFDNERIITVEPDDQIVGYPRKLEAHLGDGTLHRAFSIFLFNESQQVLLQKRSQSKFLWPGFWSNTCCSHPRKGESLEKAVHRRIREEMGCAASLHFVYRFTYHATYLDVGSEHEICSVYVGKAQGTVTPNQEEIDAHQWIEFEDLDEWVNTSPEAFTPWFKMEWNKLRGSSISTELSVLGRASPTRMSD